MSAKILVILIFSPFHTDCKKPEKISWRIFSSWKCRTQSEFQRASRSFLVEFLAWAQPLLPNQWIWWKIGCKCRRTTWAVPCCGRRAVRCNVRGLSTKTRDFVASTRDCPLPLRGSSPIQLPALASIIFFLNVLELHLRAKLLMRVLLGFIFYSNTMLYDFIYNPFPSVSRVLEMKYLPFDWK